MNTKQARIFISYSHLGNGPQWKTALLRALHVFEQQHLLDVWQDGKIRISSYWDDEIKQAMASARIAVVLLTPEALNSEYILKEEFPFLRDRQQREKLSVFPVVCEECDWRSHDWLRATQAPNGSNPLAKLSEYAQDDVFRKLATDISEELSRIMLAEMINPDQSPVPATRVYLDKFRITNGPGLREEKLIGRAQELALLDLAFGQSQTAVVSLVAWGGVGKTMLVQHWLQRLQREGWFEMSRVYAWSFYSQGTKEDRQASEDTFLAHALEWFGVQCEPTLSPWDKGRLLADAITRERTLLILDGVEPLQYPPGPMGGQFRAPGVQSLLKQLTRKAISAAKSLKPEVSNCLCLVTTREPLTDLADFQRREGALWGSVLRVDLGNLTAEAGAALLHHAGANRAGAAEIKPGDKELLAASREVDGHALTLNLLGRFLARAHSGDIRRSDLVKFEDADRQEQGGTTFKMLAAFEKWFARSGDFGARQLSVLRILGLFDRPADAGCIAALRKAPIIVGLTDPLFTATRDARNGQVTAQPLVEEDWNIATSFLADFGLLVFQAVADNAERLVDCHPLIREFFAKQLSEQSPGAWKAANRRLYEYLRDSTTEGDTPTLDAIQPLYQAVAHGCKARMHQETGEKVYFARIQRGNKHYAPNVLGAWGSEVEAIACFFEQPWSRPSPLLTAHYQAWLLSQASFSLGAVGRVTEAFEPMRAGLEMRIKLKDWQNAARDASNLSELELTLGDVPGAVGAAEQAVTHADCSGNEFLRWAFRAGLATAQHQAGNLSKALDLFHDAEIMKARDQPDYPLLYSLAGFSYCDLLLAAPERTAWQTRLGRDDSPNHPQRDGTIVPHLESCRAVELRAEQTLAWAEPQRFLLDLALDHLSLGRAALYGAALSPASTKVNLRTPSTPTLAKAVPHLTAAVEGLRLAGIAHHIPRALLTRAWLRVIDGRITDAQADLDEARDIADRGPMRLHMADIHLYRARLFFREKPYPWKSPQDDLAAAEKLINDCGYHRRDEELADAKRAILGTKP